MYWINEFVGMIIGGTIGFVAAFWFTRKEVSRVQEESRLAKIDAYKRELVDILEEAVHNTKAANAILLHMHNGADQLYAGKRMYSSAVEEAPEDPDISVKADWQDYLVDDAYMDLIRRLKRETVIILHTHEMPASVLRRKYESMGVTCSIVFWANETKGGPYYVSYPSRIEDPTYYTETEEFVKLETNVNKIRNLNRRAKKAGILH